MWLSVPPPLHPRHCLYTSLVYSFGRGIGEEEGRGFPLCCLVTGNHLWGVGVEVGGPDGNWLGSAEVEIGASLWSILLLLEGNPLIQIKFKKICFNVFLNSKIKQADCQCPSNITHQMWTIVFEGAFGYVFCFPSVVCVFQSALCYGKEQPVTWQPTLLNWQVLTKIWISSERIWSPLVAETCLQDPRQSLSVGIYLSHVFVFLCNCHVPVTMTWLTSWPHLVISESQSADKSSAMSYTRVNTDSCYVCFW